MRTRNLDLHRHLNSLIAIIWCLAAGTGMLQAQTRQLSVMFTNQNTRYGNADVHFMFGGGGAVQGTIDYLPSNAVVALTPNQDYTLAQVGARGITISNFSGGKIIVSLGGSVVSTNAAYNPGFPDFAAGSGDPASQVRWDKLEATILASTSPSPSSGINMSAADFFSIPMAVVTKRNGTNVDTVRWHPATATATVFSNLAALTYTNLGYAAVLANSASAISNCIPAYIGGGVSNVLRVISPANVPAAAKPNPYRTFERYLAHVQSNHIPVHVTGTYGGLLALPTSPLPAAAFSNQTYAFTATMKPNGDLVFVGTGSLVSTQTITVPSPNVAPGLYSADPVYSLASLPNTDLHNYNSIYDSVLSDAIAGFNLGLVGTTNLEPRSGKGLTNAVTMIGQETTDAWFSRGPTYGLNPKFTAAELFSALWPPQQPFYNPYAAYLSLITDAYSFPYTDKTAKPLLDLTYPVADTFEIIILPDQPTGVRFLNWAPLSGGGIQFTFNVPAGTNYSIEACEDLSSWQPIHTAIGQPGGIESYSDSTATPTKSRYYRIHL
jgi:hypothetical protein